MKPEDVQVIRSLTLFSALDEERLAAVCRGARLQRFPKGIQLFEAGESADFLMVLTEGAVELVAEACDGRETVVEIVWPVQSFILAAVLTGTPYLMSARTLQASRVLMLEAGAFRAAVAADTRLGTAATAELAGQFRQMVRQIKDLKLRTGTQRLGCFLLRLVAETGEGNTALLPFDKRTLASRLGMRPENISRAFATLRDFGVVVEGPRVTLTDPATLAEHCQPDPLIDGRETELSIPPV